MKKIIIKIVKLYQKYISAGTPKSCRYHPTCSSYMIDAVMYHGAVKGSIMGVSRICRCHPFIKGGIDYVPLRFTLRRNKDETYPGPYKTKK